MLLGLMLSTTIRKEKRRRKKIKACFIQGLWFGVAGTLGEKNLGEENWVTHYVSQKGFRVHAGQLTLHYEKGRQYAIKKQAPFYL